MAISRDLKDYSVFVFYPNRHGGSPRWFATSRYGASVVVDDSMPEWFTLTRQWAEKYV